MKRFPFLFPLLILLSLSLIAADLPLPQLFQKAKEEFGRGRYADALKTLDALDEGSRQPGFERDRKQLEPVIAFYRGASLIALGKEAEGKEELRRYLAFNPSARVSDEAYPRKVVEAFEEVRLERQSESTPSQDLATVLAAFVPQRGLAADVAWGETPLRYLMTSDEKAAWARVRSEDERAAFVETFWAKRDPTPGSTVNEFRTEVEKRILFADAVFSTDERPGHASDRALALVFLGPPSHIGRTQIRGGQSAMDTLRGRTQGTNLGKGRQSAGAGGSLAGEFDHGTVETWYYKPGEVPKPVAFPELQLQFITRRGYGTDVLEKESRALQSIDQRVAAVAAALSLD